MYEVCFPNRDKLLEVRSKKAVKKDIGLTFGHMTNKDEATKYVNEHELSNYKWFDGYDKMTGGIHPGDSLVFFGDRESGKTMLALSAVHELAKQGKTITYITLDERPELILKKIAGRDREEIRDYDLNVIDPDYRIGGFNKERHGFDIENIVRTEEQKKHGEFSPKYYNDEELENDVIVIDGVYLGAKELNPLKCIHDWNMWAILNNKIVIITILTEGEEERFITTDELYISTDQFEHNLNHPVDFGMFIAYLQELKKKDGFEEIACSVVRNKNDYRARACGGFSSGFDEGILLNVDIQRCEVLDSKYESIKPYVSN